MKLCGFDVLPRHGGAQRSVTKSGNPLCDQSHVELSLREGLAQHLTGSVEV
jgi:hypothetical protein